MTGGTDMPSSPVRSSRERLVFLDALRGFALILMVLNHTSRWWMDGSMRWSRYYFIYVTMAVAAPVFLFLVGFCLPLSLTRARGGAAEQLPSTLWKYAKRGGRLIIAGLLLNVLVFPEDPFWSNGVLQTIGLSIIVAAPVGLFLRSTTARSVLLAISALLYLSFAWANGPLVSWVQAHPGLSRVLFFEFPPWPWVALVLFGLVPGEMFVERTDPGSRSRYMWGMAGVGSLCIAWLFAYDWWARTQYRWMFKRDFILNNHWTPRGASVVWVIGTVFCLMALFYYVGEVRRLRMTWLVTLGQTALFLYFVHHFIVLTLVNQRLHLMFNNWWRYGLANLLLMLVLLGLGRSWLEIKRLWRDRSPALGVFRRA
ncbi:MAG TPA: heparan-alpha-glucosaminide N-acetyltransferase domain-containing protein [Candidatus Methylomirabilis sp.]|nr:heparan-alpha-glucosaminide N-acetyltransferase domain-containing protein [Candidatus Methylomirabilis sp.]